MIFKRLSVIWFLLFGSLVRLDAEGPEVTSSQDAAALAQPTQQAQAVPQLPQEIWSYIFSLGLKNQGGLVQGGLVPNVLAVGNRRMNCAMYNAAQKNLHDVSDYHGFVYFFSLDRALEEAKNKLFAKNIQQQKAAQEFLCEYYLEDEDFVFDCAIECFRNENVHDCDLGYTFLTHLILLYGDACASRFHSRAVFLCANRDTRIVGLKMYYTLVFNGYYKAEALGQAKASMLTNNENICFWSLRVLLEVVGRADFDSCYDIFLRTLRFFESWTSVVRVKALNLLSDCVVQDADHRGIEELAGVLRRELMSDDDTVYQEAVRSLIALVIINYEAIYERALEESRSGRLDNLNINLLIDLVHCLVSEGYAQALPRACSLLDDQRAGRRAKLRLASELARNQYADAYPAGLGLAQSCIYDADPAIRIEATWALVHLVHDNYQEALNLSTEVALHADQEQDEDVFAVIEKLKEALGLDLVQ